MQLKPGRWLAFRATQEARVDAVEFTWRAVFRMAPFVTIRVEDWYRDGDGGLEGRLLGLIPIASAGGSETARSEAMRYLAELPWFPHAIPANRAVAWRDAGNGNVEVATAVGEQRASVTWYFGGEGELTAVSAANRPRQEGRRTVERPWRASFGDEGDVGGVRIPREGEVVWELPEGPFTYFRGRITGLELR
jgi:hypothetical protein